MRKLVACTYIIMLSAALLFGSGDTMTVSASSPTEKIMKTTPKPTPLPYFASGNPTVCTNQDLGYSSINLTIAKEQQKGLITAEIGEEKASEEEVETAAQTPEEVISPIQEVAAITASASATPTIEVPSITEAPEAGASGVLNAEVLFSLVNQTRANAGLPAFQKHPEVCSVVNSRAPELDNEIYGSSYMHAGFKSRSLPFWATENVISQQTEQAALNWWMNSPVHRSAVLGNYTYACTACAGKSCAMIFSNMEPK